MNINSPSTGEDQKTSKKITAAAEELFAKKGFDAVSLRDITNKAGVNVASVSYYFGGKDALIQAVILKHAGPINQKRDEYIEVLKRRSGDQPIPLKDILRAFVAPFAEHVKEQRDMEMFTKFIGRVMSDAALKLPDELFMIYRRTMNKFTEEITKTVSGFTEQDSAWHLNFCFGSLMNTFLNRETLQRVFGETFGESLGDIQLEEIIEMVVTFAEGGINKASEAKNN